ncbi:restriction endonuclease subunit S [Marinobacter nauticus]|uniref:Restriction modification system DNA specificity domain n=1 Tax=Marinobacter nauticus (strain ATCC 700491 / DSM 11845 / VT8) TaxID=351348 RepID=A1TXP8_MARN8|nr:restriction endonuclease subunit S [Marinobacter nauticus]ABM17517.1 restriction modification system DNA specificity domain [Marinobacter nauticus VT8]
MSFVEYPEYKGSGVQWLGEVPSNWKIGRLKHLLRIRGGQDYKSVESYVPTDFPVIGSGGQFTYATDYLYDGESVLLGRKGTIDKPLYVKGKFWTVDTMFYTEVLPGTNGRYAYYLATTIPFDLYSTNTALPSMSQFDLANHGLPLPPKCEQTQIARFLDHETAKIDALIREQERLIELLQEKRQAVISHAVTKGLDPDVPMKDSGVEWLGEVPAHWIVARIKNFARVESGHTPDKKKEEYWVDCDIPWVSLNDSKQLKKADYIADTSTKVNDLGIANSSARLLPAAAVVFTRDASIGLSAITTKPMAVSQHLIAWLCAGEKLVPEYLLLIFYAMESEFERYTFGATIKTIGMDDVRSLTAAFPPMEEQKQLVTWAFRKKETLQAGLDAAEKTILLLKERRSALISSAVTGKIDVRNWQPPADEGAFDEEVRAVGMEATA